MNVQGQWYLPAYSAPAAAQPNLTAANMAAIAQAQAMAQAAQPQPPQGYPQASPYAVPQGYQQSDSAKFMGLPGPHSPQLFGMGQAPPQPPQPQGHSNQAYLNSPGSAAAAFYQAAGLAALQGLHPSALLAAASASSAAAASPAPPMGQHAHAQAAAAAAAAAASQQASMRQLLGGGGGNNGFSVFSKLPLLKTPAGSHHHSPLKVRHFPVTSGVRQCMVQ